MSKLKRLLGALSLVALFIFSSCVDDKVAPEVAALRQAQVDLLNADAAYRAAETALKNADVAYRQAEVANQEAMTATITIGNDQLAATNALELAALTEENKSRLVAAEQALLAAQADLAQYLATAGLEEAAEYLATWNAIMTGGPGAPDLAGNVPAGGLAGVKRQIGAKQAEIAGLSLFYTTSLSPGPQIPQSVLIARAQEQVTMAEAGLVGLNASIEAAKAVIEGAENPAASLEEALLALAADTVAQNAKLDSIAAVVAALTDGLAREDSIVSAFENQAPSTGTLYSNRTGYGDGDANEIEISGVLAANHVSRGNDWVTQMNSIDAANAAIAVAAGDTVVWLAYADSLQGIYDKYAETVESFEAYIKPFRDDSIAAKAALDAASPGDAVDAANELAYAEYITALNVFAAKSNSFLNGNTLATGASSFYGDGFVAGTGGNGITAMRAGETYAGKGGNLALLVAANKPTLADTTALVAARTAWDGLTKNLMFDDWDPNRYGTNIGGTNFTVDLTDGIAGVNKLNGGELTGGIANGGDNPYQNSQGTIDPVLLAAVNRANALLEAAEQEYDNVVTEFAKLKAYIADVKSGDEDNGAYGSSLPDLSSTGTLFGDYNSELTAASTAILKLPVGGTGGLQLYPDIDAAVTAVATQEAAIKAAEKIIADNDAFTSEYVEAYVAALAALAEQAEIIDSLKIGPEFARFSALEALGALEDEMQSIKDQIDALANTEITLGSNGLPTVTDVVIFVDENGVEYTSIGSSMDDENEGTVWGYINSADVDGAEDAITSAQKAVSDAENGLTTLEGLLAEAEVELAVLETQETVLQALADEVQALLEAALAG